MKKSKPNPIQKQTYQTVKALGESKDSRDVKAMSSKAAVATNSNSSSSAAQVVDNNESYLNHLEAEIMGDYNQGNKSDLVAKNLNQMIGVLNTKMKSLENNANLRIKLCEDDLNANVTETSKNAPKIGDDLDDSMAQSKSNKSLHKENLVSTDNLIIDPVRLVIRSKMQTETAKKLEAKLEESFGVSGNQEKNFSKTKQGSVVMKNKKSEQQKFEAKKNLVLKLEKDLQEGIEVYITRSILDNSLIFKAPAEPITDPLSNEHQYIFPISLKWPSSDPRSLQKDNSDGQMNPECLLRYAIERINITSAVSVIKWLVKQSICQNYFVYLFWLIKIKFFQHSASTSDEQFLLKHLSREYVGLINLMSSKTREEHEKDLIYRFVPYVFSTAIYYAMFYLCPSSRHLYTKGFRKTIYMQVVQIMYGLQVCPISVKVAWAKLFPEFHDDDDVEGLEVAEALPIHNSLVSGAKMVDTRRSHLMTLALERETLANELLESTLMRSVSAPALTTPADASRKSSSNNNNNNNNNNSSSNNNQNNTHSNTKTINSSIAPEVKPTDRVIAAMAKKKINPVPADILKDVMSHLRKNEFEKSFQSSSKLPDNLADLNFGSGTYSIGIDDGYAIGEAEFNNSIDGVENAGGGAQGMLMADGSAELIKSRNMHSPYNRSRASTADTDLTEDKRDEKPNVYIPPDTEIIKEMSKTDPLYRTNLRAPLEKPKSLTQEVQRQNTESLDGKSVSPMIQQFLERPSQSGGIQKQTIRRTVPISWCAAGGSDTYNKRVVPKELHDEISVKASKVAKDFKYNSWLFHHRKMSANAKIDQMCEMVLKSGATKVSRFSLDVVKSQGRNSKNQDQKTDLSETMAVETIEDIQRAAQLDNTEIDDFIASLS